MRQSKSGPQFVCPQCQQRVSSLWPKGQGGPLVFKNHKEQGGVEYCLGSRAPISQGKR